MRSGRRRRTLRSMTYKGHPVWAAKRDVALGRISVEVADLDTRGRLLGVADDVRPWCRDVRVALELTGSDWSS